MHEVIHSMGPIDNTMQQALFGSKQPGGWRAERLITTKLQNDCFPSN
jgi:hypothetical protein